MGEVIPPELQLMVLEHLNGQSLLQCKAFLVCKLWQAYCKPRLPTGNKQQSVYLRNKTIRLLRSQLKSGPSFSVRDYIQDKWPSTSQVSKSKHQVVYKNVN